MARGAQHDGTSPPGLGLFSTHGITVEEGIAVKRFRSPVDGDENR